MILRSLLPGLFLLVLMNTSSNAQYGNPSSSGSYGLAMGNITSIHSGPENCFSNPANIARADVSSISSFIDSRYFISSLFGAYIGGTLAMENSGFSVDYYNYGWESYSENAVGLAYGRKFVKNLSVGIKFKMLNVSVEEYGNQSAFSIDLGLHQMVTDQLGVGFIVSNPLSTDLGEDQALQSSLTLGISYLFSEKFTAAVEFFKEEDFDLEARFGFDYQFLEKVALLGGYQSREHQFSFGLQLQPISKIDITASSTLHPTLGISSSVGVNYSFK